jgi:biotin operon repressor
MTELLLPRLKQEIEARLAELRPIVEEIEQLEAAKAALLARSELPPASARRRAAARNGAAAPTPTPAPAATPAPARRRRAARAAPAKAAEAEGERAPRGANRDAILKLVEERPGVSVAEIASVTKITKATVATTVSKLKRDGVLADEAGGVKLASRQPLTIAGPIAASSSRDDGVSDTEWDEAAPSGGDGSEDAAA